MFGIHPVAFATSVLTSLSHVGGAAVAIVVVTLLVRLALHPLTRAAVRGERARAALAPRVAELRRKHRGNAVRLGEEITTLYHEEQISPFAGTLPLLVQAPVFIVLYQAFHSGTLRASRLLGVPLSARLLTGGHPLVFAAALALVAALAWGTARRAAYVMRAAPHAAPTGPAATVVKLAPYTLLVSAALLPLANVLYLITSTAWTLAENMLLRRGLPDV